MHFLWLWPGWKAIAMGRHVRMVNRARAGSDEPRMRRAPPADHPGSESAGITGRRFEPDSTGRLAALAGGSAGAAWPGGPLPRVSATPAARCTFVVGAGARLEGRRQKDEPGARTVYPPHRAARAIATSRRT